MLNKLTWEIFFREFKGLIFALSYAQVNKVGPLSFQEVFHLHFGAAAADWGGPARHSEITTPPDTQTLPSSRLNSSSVNYIKMTKPDGFVQEDIFFCLGRGTKQQVVFVFSLAERRWPPVLQFHTGFFLSVPCSSLLWQPWHSSTVCTLWLGRQSVHPATPGLPHKSAGWNNSGRA